MSTNMNRSIGGSAHDAKLYCCAPSPFEVGTDILGRKPCGLSFGATLLDATMLFVAFDNMCYVATPPCFVRLLLSSSVTAATSVSLAIVTSLDDLLCSNTPAFWISLRRQTYHQHEYFWAFHDWEQPSKNNFVFCEFEILVFPIADDCAGIVMLLYRATGILNSM